MKKPDSKTDFLTAFGLYGGVGFQLAFAVVGGYFLGAWLDEKWDTKPWLSIVLLVLGAIGGFVNFIRILNWKNKK